MNSVMLNPTVMSFCKAFNENQTLKALGVEVLGINLPKTVLVRTRHEAMDVAVNEFGNTVGFFGGLWGMGKLLDKALHHARIPIQPMLNPHVLNQGRLAKTLAIAPPLVSLMLAMPFFRNAFTAFRTGTTDYKKLITQKHQVALNAVDKARAQQAGWEYFQKGQDMVEWGLLLGLGAFLLAASRRPLGLFKNGQLRSMFNQPWLKSLLNKGVLEGPKALELKDRHAILYWGIPAYLGWIWASRDKFEVKEQFLKMVNFILVYCVTDHVVKAAMNGPSVKFAKKLPWAYPGGDFSYQAVTQRLGKTLAGLAQQPVLQKALAFENLKTFAKLGSTAVLMAVIPALLNIYFTQQRMAREKQASY